MKNVFDDIGVRELSSSIVELADAAATIHSGVAGNVEHMKTETQILDRIGSMYAIYDGMQENPSTERFFENIFAPGGLDWVSEYVGFRIPKRNSFVPQITSDTIYSVTPSTEAMVDLHTAAITMAKIVMSSGDLKSTGTGDLFQSIQNALSFYAEDTGEPVPPEFSLLTESSVIGVVAYSDAVRYALHSARILETLYNKTPVPQAQDIVDAIKRFIGSVSALHSITAKLMPDIDVLSKISPVCSEMSKSDSVTDAFMESFCSVVPAILESLQKIIPECGVAIASVISTVSPMDMLVNDINSDIAPDTLASLMGNALTESVIAPSMRASFMGKLITESADDSGDSETMRSPAARAIRSYMMMFSYVRFSKDANLPGSADYESLVSKGSWKITPDLVGDIATMYLSRLIKPLSQCTSAEKNDESLRRLYNDNAVDEVTSLYSGALSKHLYDEATGAIQDKRMKGGRPNQIQNFGWSIGAEMKTYIRSMKQPYMIDAGQTPYQYVLRYAAGNLDPNARGFSDKVNDLLRKGRGLRIWYAQPNVGIEVNASVLSDRSLQQFLDAHRTDYMVDTNVARNAGRGARVFLRFSSERKLREALEDLNRDNLVMPVKEIPSSEEQFPEMHGKAGDDTGSVMDNITEADLPMGDPMAEIPESISVIKDNAREIIKQLRVIRGLIIHGNGDADIPPETDMSSVTGIVRYADKLITAVANMVGVSVTSSFNSVLGTDCPTLQSLNALQDSVQFSDNTALKRSVSYMYKILRKCADGEHSSVQSDTLYKFYSSTPEDRLKNYIPTMNFGAYVKMLEHVMNLKSASDNVRSHAKGMLIVANLFSTGEWGDAGDRFNMDAIKSSSWFSKYIPIPLYVSTDTPVRSILQPEDFPEVTLITGNTERAADECVSASINISVSIFSEANALAEKLLSGETDAMLFSLMRPFIDVHRKTEGKLVTVPDDAYNLVHAIPRDMGVNISKESRRSAYAKSPYAKHGGKKGLGFDLGTFNDNRLDSL